MKFVHRSSSGSFAVLLLAAVLIFAAGCDQSPSLPTSTFDLRVSFNEQLGVPLGDFHFETPVRVMTGGVPISVDEPGYACPTIADVDGDGADDLVVGQFSQGRMRFYRNLNAPGETPRFAAGKWIKSGEQIAVVPGVS